MFQNGVKSANTQGRSLENDSSNQKVLSQVLEMLSSASMFSFHCNRCKYNDSIYGKNLAFLGGRFS